MSGLRILYFNAAGLQSKSDEFIGLLRVENIDIACICETFLKDKSDTAELNTLHEYTIIRNDRMTRLGGLLTIIKTNIKFSELTFPTTELIEYSAFWIEASPPFVLINAYLPGGAKQDIIKQHYNADLNKIFDSTRKPLFCVGDLNSKHHTWGCKRNNLAGKILYKKTQSRSLVISYPIDNTYVPMTAKKITIHN